MVEFVAIGVLLIGACGIGHLLYCIRRQRLTERNLAIGGLLVILNFVLLALLVIGHFVRI
jgi:hypothetical protein